MKSYTLGSIIGALLFFVGLIGVFTLWPTYQECISPVGKLARTFDPETELLCSTMMNYFYASGIGSLLGLVIIYFPQSNPQKSPDNIDEKDNGALEIAQRRLARGEITIEEYEELRKRLE